jgi:hypothetical protein
MSRDPSCPDRPDRAGPFGRADGCLEVGASPTSHAGVFFSGHRPNQYSCNAERELHSVEYVVLWILDRRVVVEPLVDEVLDRSWILTLPILNTGAMPMIRSTFFVALNIGRIGR